MLSKEHYRQKVVILHLISNDIDIGFLPLEIYFIKWKREKEDLYIYMAGRSHFPTQM